MNPDYHNHWPESYPVTHEAVREHLYGRPSIGDPAMWRRCAEYFDAVQSPCGTGICYWMDRVAVLGPQMGSEYCSLARFFEAYMRPNTDFLWPCRDEFAPRRAALCRTVAALLEELQLNPPTA